MRYAKIREMDISNGRGIGVTLFVQGCKFHCKGCFNPETWDFNSGYKWNILIEDEFISLCKKPHINHISILGGEPLQQDGELLFLLKRIKAETNKPIYLWTGYNFQDIPDNKKEILNYIDELTDGEFVEELKHPSLIFKGSSNQRLLKKNERGIFEYQE